MLAVVRYSLTRVPPSVSVVSVQACTLAFVHWADFTFALLERLVEERCVCDSLLVLVPEYSLILVRVLIFATSRSDQHLFGLGESP